MAHSWVVAVSRVVVSRSHLGIADFRSLFLFGTTCLSLFFLLSLIYSINARSVTPDLSVTLLAFFYEE